MTKRTGLGNRLAVAGFDISGDAGMVDRLGGGPAALAATGLDKSAMERLGGRLEAAAEFTSFFNPAAGAAHEILSTLPRTAEGLLYALGNTLGEPSAGMVGKRIDYAGERDEEGNLRFEVQSLSDGFGLHWGQLLTPWPRADGATPTNGASLDNTAASAEGLTAFLQVFAIASGSATVAIQSSSDDAVGDPFATITGGTFTAVTAVGSERIATADDQSVERYLRVVTTGTFTGLSFAVMVARG
jgi:hypothetical protein